MIHTQMNEVSWSQLKLLIAYGSFRYYKWDDTTKQQRVIRAAKSSLNQFVCFLPLFVPGDPGYSGSECAEFDDDFSNDEGDRDSYFRSFSFDLSAGGNVHVFQLLGSDDAPHNVYLSSGTLHAKDVSWADKVQMQVFDKDGILGMGENVVLKEFLTVNIAPDSAGRFSATYDPTSADWFDAKAKILMGLYVRVVFTAATGGGKVIYTFSYEYR